MHYTLAIPIKTPDDLKMLKVIKRLTQTDMENTAYRKFMPEKENIPKNKHHYRLWWW
jgi:hypothetical protein